MAAMKQLTKSQQKVYDFLKERLEYGVPPTVREICAATGLSSTSTVHGHLRALENAGYISREAGLNRSIRIEGQEHTKQVPIVGRVTAGIPILAVEEITGYIPFTAECFGGTGRKYEECRYLGRRLCNFRKNQHSRRRRNCGCIDRRGSDR